MSDTNLPQFIYLTCQNGAESALKNEMARQWPDFRFAFSRPGFMTYKVPDDVRVHPDFDPDLVFARSWGLSLGKVHGDDPLAMADQLWQQFGERPIRRIHVWPRDIYQPGEHGFEPVMTDHARDVHRILLERCPEKVRDGLTDTSAHSDNLPRRGDFVLDCVLVQSPRPVMPLQEESSQGLPKPVASQQQTSETPLNIEENGMDGQSSELQWWFGYHRVRSFASKWPGGLLPLVEPDDCASRAWLKFEEGLRWSGFPIEPGTRCVDIGCAPGGSSQTLLARGAEVLGIDPADIERQVRSNRRFTHLKKRTADVQRRDLRHVRWLLCDMNVAPNYTLEALESIVTHPLVSIRGMLFTLKLFEWRLAEQIPAYRERIESWGFNEVDIRQLQFNRQEVMVAALQHPFQKKSTRSRRSANT